MRRLILGIALAVLTSTAGAQNVYMQTFEGRAWMGPVRGLILSRDNLVSLEECLARKAEVEKTSFDSPYVRPNVRVECLPQELRPSP